MKRCDVLVVGAGPAGMAAAVRASECGKRVTVVDDNANAGGQIWRGGPTHSPQVGWFRKFESCGAELLTGCRVIGGDAKQRSLKVETPDASFDIECENLILATGARELFLPFPGWTQPNVMGVGGLQAFVKSGLPVKGKRIVVAGSGPLLLAVAAYLRKRGAIVRLVVEQADSQRLFRFALDLLAHPEKLWQAITLRTSLGFSHLTNAWVEAVEGDCIQIRGAKSVSQIDYLAIAYGLRPNTELAQYLGCPTKDGAVTVDEFQQTSVNGIHCAGEVCGIGGVDLALIQGQIAGYVAAGRRDLATLLFPARTKARRFAESLNRTFALRSDLRGLPKQDTIVCRCEDVRFGPLQTANSWRSAKLHLRCGMGPCQGRVCGPSVKFLFGWEPESIRLPVFPARVASLLSEEARK